MANRATGSFEVKLAPQPIENNGEETSLGRMSIDKRFEGGLQAVSKGQMLTAGTPVKGSAVYVAVETITGTLNGRSGAFTLYHTGVMTRGEPRLSITVVPDSGSGELAGLTGQMSITIENGKHSYDFEYAIAE